MRRAGGNKRTRERERMMGERMRGIGRKEERNERER